MTECPILRGGGPPLQLMAPPPIGQSRGVVQVTTTTPLHGPV